MLGCPTQVGRHRRPYGEPAGDADAALDAVEGSCRPDPASGREGVERVGSLCCTSYRSRGARARLPFLPGRLRPQCRRACWRSRRQPRKIGAGLSGNGAARCPWSLALLVMVPTALGSLYFAPAYAVCSPQQEVRRLQDLLRSQRGALRFVRDMQQEFDPTKQAEACHSLRRHARGGAFAGKNQTRKFALVHGQGRSQRAGP